MDEMKEKYDFYLKIFERLVNEVYDGSISDAQILLGILIDLLINVVPQLYLKHRRLSYDDFCKQLDTYLKQIREGAIKEYKDLLMKEKF